MKILAVIDKNRALGYKNSLLFRLPTDLAHFKRHTIGKTVVMGQRTLESMPKGKPLPGRNTLVLNIDAPTGPVCELEGGYICFSFQRLEDFTEYVLDNMGFEDLIVAGGASIYRLFLRDCDELVLTEVEAEAENADVWFPEFKDLFELKETDGPYFDGDLEYNIRTYVKKDKPAV
jgi:dihydrofolate reductase